MISPEQSGDIKKNYCGHKIELFLDNLGNQELDNLRDHKQCAVNNVRIILRREMLIKKIFWGILLDFLIPVLICFIILSIATGNWEDALIVLQEERRKCIILVLFIIFSNAIIVFAVGYCMVY